MAALLSSLQQLIGVFLQPFYLIPILTLLTIWILKHIEYKSSAYYQVNKTLFHAIRHDTGRYGEYLTYKQLRHLEKEGARFLFNVYIPTEAGETTEIDILLLTRNGIFVIESKNYSGWIFGSETQKNWCQTLPAGKGKSRKSYFYNPVMQNQSHIKHLKSFLGEEIPMYSIIVFSQRCTLKDVTIKNSEIHVIHRDQASAVISGICSTSPCSVLADIKIANLYTRLYPFTQLSESEKAQHVVAIQNSFAQKTKFIPDMPANPSAVCNESDLHASPLPVSTHDEHVAEQCANAAAPPAEPTTCRKDSGNTSAASPVPVCPQCGVPLVLRTATKGSTAGKQFWGCSNFPKCRYSKGIK